MDAVTFDRRWPVVRGVADVFGDGTIARGAFARSLSHRQPKMVGGAGVVSVSDEGLEVVTGAEFDTLRIVGRVLDCRAGVVAEVAIGCVELIKSGPSIADLEAAQRRRRAGVVGVDYNGG